MFNYLAQSAKTYPVAQLSANDRRPPDRFSRVSSANLVHLKCSEWLRNVLATGDTEDDEGYMDLGKEAGPAMVYTSEESASIVSKLMKIYKTLPDVSTVVFHRWIYSHDAEQVSQRPYQLVSTWVEECTEDFFMDDCATERASLHILISSTGDLSSNEAETSFLEAELGLMQSRLRRAQTEVELLSDAIQYLIESNTGKYICCL